MPMVDGKKYSYGAKGMAAAKKAAKKKRQKDGNEKEHDEQIIMLTLCRQN